MSATAVMTSVSETHRGGPFDPDRLSARTKDLPVHSASATTSGHSSAEPMDLSPRVPTEEVQINGSPSADRHGTNSGSNSDKEGTGSNHPVGAAAAAQQPKVVQTAFIHKLYSMLEDQSIQHLISWSNTNESFVMSPSTEFSKVLASYFKHTNISSFVRQLNMYGFHKVSDVFHTGSPDSPLWEFKHGGGNFKRGDLNGLREIKRRASRHALIHRDSFSSAPKVAPQHMPAPEVAAPPPPPPQPAAPQDPLEARLQMMEYSFNELHVRLARTEDAFATLSSRCQAFSEGIARCYQYSSELSTSIMNIIPDPENPIHKEVSALRSEIAKQSDQLKFVTPARPLYVEAPNSYDPMAPPLSPRHQQVYDGARRPSLQVPGVSAAFRTPLPPHLASPRRQGSYSGESGISPSSANGRQYTTLPPPPPPPPPQPAQQPQPHPLANVELPPANLSRRHTSADIRLQGWNGAMPPQPPSGSPYASGQQSAHWPSSPYRAAADQEGREMRNSLAQYDIGKAQGQARHNTPPPEAGVPSYAGVGNEAGWQLPGPKFPFRNIDFSAPPTRRSSMASNVHSLLNPADTAEREGEDEPIEERKRKRMV